MISDLYDLLVDNGESNGLVDVTWPCLAICLLFRRVGLVNCKKCVFLHPVKTLERCINRPINNFRNVYDTYEKKGI